MNPNANLDWSIRSLTFSSGAGGFVIQGNTLTLGAGGIRQSMAKGAVQTAYKDLEIGLHRSVQFSASEPQTWGMFFSEKTEHILDWKLPVKAIDQTQKADFTPNQYLIDTLFKSLGEYNKGIQYLNESSQGLTKITLANKRMAVLNALPAPLAEPLRKLIVPVEQENEGYDKVSEAGSIDCANDGSVVCDGMP